MKIINPFNLLMYVVIYVVTFHYLRMKPFTMNGRVGWASDEGEHAVAYDPMSGSIALYSRQTDLKVIEGRAMPDGSISSWFRTPAVYYAMLHAVVGDYLDYTYEEKEDDNPRRPE